MKESLKEPLILPLPKKNSREAVFEKLKQLIDDGYWKPEEKIFSEAELCEKFNVGRSTIREAVNMLKAHNLLYTVPGLGSFVNKVEEFDDPAFIDSYVPNPASALDLVNVMEFRLSLEPLNAAFAARRAKKADLREMERCLRELDGSSDTAVFAESDLAFHILIARMTGNPIVIEAMDRIRTYLLGQQVASAAASGRRKRAAQFHSQIHAALARHDALEAEDAMRSHMDDTYTYVKSLVTTSERQSGRWPIRQAPKA